MGTNGAQLDVNGEIVASPGEGDVSAAIDKAARSAQGYVTVTRSGGFYLEAAPSDEGGDLLSLACGDEQKGQRQFATAPVTGAEAKALFRDFFDGGDAWRQQCRWRSRDTRMAASTAAPSNRSLGPFVVWLAVGGAAAAALMFLFVPVLFPAALGLALCVFVIGKARREAHIRRWPQANGRITASGLQPRRRRFRREATRLDNIPSLDYEFSVAGRRYVGSRLGLNTEYAGVDVGALVARYPVGAIVPVYYNPSDPNDCLLDRDANRGLAGEALKLVAIVGALVAALYYGAPAVTHVVAAHFPNANAPHVVFAASGGLLFLLLFVWSFRSQPQTAVAPRAPGTIVKSELEEVVLDVTSPADYIRGQGGGISHWQPTIEVAYSVAGQSYTLRTGVGEGIVAPTKEDAQARLAPYSVGTTVRVIYSAGNPDGARLEGNPTNIADAPTRISYRLAVLAGAFACFVMAIIALGVL